jgi:hypothetical protein
MRKLYLGIICLFFITSIGYCQQIDWVVPKTKADISIGESFSGATWSADSQKVYFARFVDFETGGEPAKKNKQLIEEKMVEIMKDSATSPRKHNEAFEKAFEGQNVPGPLYYVVVVYSYDIATKTVQIVAIIPYSDMSPVFFFSDSLADNKISFCSGGGSQVHLIDLSTGQDVPIKGKGCQFLNRSDKITVETLNFQITNRYLSPDRHSFIEIPSNALALNEIRIFHDPNVNLKTMAELGSEENLAATTASIDQIKAYQANMAKIMAYQATEKISPEQLYTPEEKEIRARFGI